MLAVDTNILVRFLTYDEPTQAARATALLRSNEIWVSKTVLLETEWVLRRSYGFPPERVLGVLRDLSRTANIFLEDPPGVWQALEWFAAGFDFADAMHVASAASSRRFVTFDEKLIRRAKGRTAVDVTRV